MSRTVIYFHQKDLQTTTAFKQVVPLFLMIIPFCCVCCLVLLGVLDQRVNERTFQARMERRLALLVGEGLGIGVGNRRWRRAASIGNNSVQVHIKIHIHNLHVSPSRTML